jgi:hypothetical protein
MKKKIIFLMAAGLISLGMKAQSAARKSLTEEDKQALENVIVERYYEASESDLKDTVGGKLPKGAVTYRIYVDLKPGYHLQAVFGIPRHEFIIKTTTAFFNNEFGGAQCGDEILDGRISNNSVALDSWLTIGAATKSRFGVLKTEDPDSSIIVGKKELEKTDGLMKGGQVQKLLYYNLDLNFFKEGRSGSEFRSDNGSWAIVGGGKGPTKENRVQIAQLTTNGKLSYELNLQVGSQSGTVIQYVAKDPEGSQIKSKFLTYKQK